MKLRYWLISIFSYLYSCWIIGTWLIYVVDPHKPIWAWNLIVVNYLGALIQNPLILWLSSEVLLNEA